MGIKCWHKYEAVMTEAREGQLQKRNKDFFFSPHMQSSIKLFLEKSIIKRE